MTAPVETYPYELVDLEVDAGPPPMPTEAEIAEDRKRRTLDRIEAGEQLLTAGTWRLAGAVEQIRLEANLANPGRDKTSDGTIGDAAHATRSSDHNPWVIVSGLGVVRAIDLDIDGLDLPTAFERARQLAVAGRLPQIAGGGYLILNRRITSPNFDRWNPYNGPNPHVAHGHGSMSLNVAGFDSRAAWGIFGSAPVPTPPLPGNGWTGPDLTGVGSSLRGVKGNNGQRVANMQQQLKTRYSLYAKHLGVDGWWGDQTTGVLREFCRRSGIVTPDTGLVLGPRTAAALLAGGIRP